MADGDAARAIRLGLLLLTELVTPMHEWLDGQRMYFRAQGYTEPEARAMAAATYVAVFGNPIHAPPNGRPQADES
ncbi:hypothetical protein KBX50_04785 [Micromonospora sp. C51]|uniref:hypothetical protein n=1 Tax=Micromonospora sp. C51 TaxID=2824879 RepID=UPI001B36CD3E|nr:hypothetical protein [Micromonospora sp. C51]MBQ1047805.1 hypothetical protein [Micromonospora sp. C51]